MIIYTICTIVAAISGFVLGRQSARKAKSKPNKITLIAYQQKVQACVIELQKLKKDYSKMDTLKDDDKSTQLKERIAQMFNVLYKTVIHATIIPKVTDVPDDEKGRWEQWVLSMKEQAAEAEKCMTEFRSLSAQ